MSTILRKATNGVSFGTKYVATAQDAIDSEVIVDFQTEYDMVASVQVLSAADVPVALTDTKITYPENGQVSIADNMETAFALANSLKTVMNAHAADGGGGLHVNADATNFPVATADATTLATLLALAGALLTAYDVHDDDSELGAAWLYHDAQESGDHSPVSAVTPTTLQEAITRLNDLKAKYNAHDADATTHTSGSNANQEATADGSQTFEMTAGYQINVLAQKANSDS